MEKDLIVVLSSKSLKMLFKGFVFFILILSVFVIFGCDDNFVSDKSFQVPESVLALTKDISTASDSEKYDLRRNHEELDGFSIVSEKNLFHPKRKLDAEEESKIDPTPTPETQKTAVEMPNLQLVGTMVLNDVNYAFIIDRQNKDSKGKALRYKTGDTIGEFSITEILNDQVVFKNGEQQARLELKPPVGRKGKSARSRGKRRGSKASQRPQSGNRPNNAQERMRRQAKEKEEKEMMKKRRNQSTRGRTNRRTSRTNRTRSPSACGR